ncbi:hypothetical protein A2774_00085 [Candidatus Roizmanbacteria bacterium RIFCSPHIGHO2_01_FULL_39_12c]|uniref:Putative pterin-4-alpha-carbinolamine dehydratase n=1 Tax=Candidatus Roizmanbacteria bacterium RIFCSPHIGHO2_01_FULL_39_12c TaxID=1802031 RepID=A0A1F7GCZ0_9BACT|nr:MAG: hypothetical protein A2774_00085 [Candidatus Roizmanbacteria bacterium RIFCSPHIGHO2_01_FULL_39_12c]
MANKLINKKCIPCEGYESPMIEVEIKDYLKEMKNDWTVIENKKIAYIFKFKTFKEAIEFVNQVAKLAESEDHHPNIHILYDKVKIVLSTHSVGGLSENDFILAAKIENLI